MSSRYAETFLFRIFFFISFSLSFFCMFPSRFTFLYFTSWKATRIQRARIGKAGIGWGGPSVGTWQLSCVLTENQEPQLRQQWLLKHLLLFFWSYFSQNVVVISRNELLSSTPFPLLSSTTLPLQTSKTTFPTVTRTFCSERSCCSLVLPDLTGLTFCFLNFSYVNC